MVRTFRNGFTLIEVVITVAIIGILLAIAVPSMTGYRKGAEREGCQDQMRTILSAIEEARLERDYDVLNTLRTTGTIDVLFSGTESANNKNRYLPESEAFGCPSGGSYTVSYNEDSDTWTVTCPNASKGHTL